MTYISKLPRPFAEYWYLLNLVGFQEVPFHREQRAERIDLKQWKVKYEHRKWRKHQGENAAWHLEKVFTDERGNDHRKWKPYRDKALKPASLPVCARCGRTDNLEKDHIVALSNRGKDEPSNLQYLCYPCHKFKTALDRIEEEIRVLEKYREIEDRKVEGFKQWRLDMWKYRREALIRLNPAGLSYTTYWNDPKTHYGRWYQRPEKKVKAESPSFPLEAFLTPRAT